MELREQIARLIEHTNSGCIDCVLNPVESPLQVADKILSILSSLAPEEALLTPSELGRLDGNEFLDERGDYNIW